jgi:hypothetical protein
MTSREYKAVKNFFHNEMRLDKGELRQLLKEVIDDKLEDVLQRFILTTEFQYKLFNSHEIYLLREQVA